MNLKNEKKIQDLPNESQAKLVKAGFNLNRPLDKSRMLGFYQCSINFYTNGFHTPLTYAICIGDFNLMKDIVDAGADLSVKGPMLPLMYAAHFGKDKIVAYLLEHGADPEAKSKLHLYGKEKRALDVARKNSQASVCSMFGLFLTVQKMCGNGDIDKTCDILQQRQMS